MTDTGKTILVERKYAIYSQFLDTVLQSEGVIQEGETRKDALLRVHRELEETAEDLRKMKEGWSPKVGVMFSNSQGEVTGTIIIDKSMERLEIAIDNCQSLEELDQLKKDNPLFPARLLESFNKKRKELSNGQG